jgi:hypothetical protein
LFIGKHIVFALPSDCPSGIAIAYESKAKRKQEDGNGDARDLHGEVPVETSLSPNLLETTIDSDVSGKVRMMIGIHFVRLFRQRPEILLNSTKKIRFKLAFIVKKTGLSGLYR